MSSSGSRRAWWVASAVLFRATVSAPWLPAIHTLAGRGRQDARCSTEHAASHDKAVPVPPDMGVPVSSERSRMTHAKSGTSPPAPSCLTRLPLSAQPGLRATGGGHGTSCLSPQGQCGSYGVPPRGSSERREAAEAVGRFQAVVVAATGRCRRPAALPQCRRGRGTASPKRRKGVVRGGDDEFQLAPRWRRGGNIGGRSAGGGASDGGRVEGGGGGRAAPSSLWRSRARTSVHWWERGKGLTTASRRLGRGAAVVLAPP